MAIGPWWRTGGQDEIDAVALAGTAETPVLFGEAKWARSVNGPRLLGKLMAKATALPATDEPRYALCAREEVTNVGDDVMVVTAADIFAHP